MSHVTTLLVGIVLLPITAVFATFRREIARLETALAVDAEKASRVTVLERDIDHDRRLVLTILEKGNNRRGSRGRPGGGSRAARHACFAGRAVRAARGDSSAEHSKAKLRTERRGWR